MQRIQIRTPLRFFLFLLLLCALALGFSLWTKEDGTDAPTAVTPGVLSFSAVVVDAGHGGEDGGTIGAGGVLEKDLNLAVATDLATLLSANGIRVVETRKADILLYDRTVNYQGRKKALDLAARRKIGEETADSLFVSIHMNSFPQAKYKGLQVWYSPNDPRSRLLAESVQETVRTALQPDNNRDVKPATSAIYLLHHLSTPAILVECGFLSNPEEAEMLNDPAYRQTLAFLLFLSVSQCRMPEKST